MSRPLRIEWPEGLYHVASRGDRREAIVEDDVDRRAWLELLGQACERFNWRVHACCLITNPYHVVLETAEANLSLGMRQLNGECGGRSARSITIGRLERRGIVNLARTVDRRCT